jgi:hypothetical protein
LRGGARLAGDAFGGSRRELADSESGADDDHAEAEGNREKLNETCH